AEGTEDALELGLDRADYALARLGERRAPHVARLDPEPLLDEPLGRKAVVVVAERVEDQLAAHAPVAGDQVGVGVRVEVADVDRARDRRRRRVDSERATRVPSGRGRV